MKLARLTDLITEAGLRYSQLGLDPLVQGAWGVDSVRRFFGEADIQILSGMMGMQGEDYSTLDTIRETGGVRPTQHWPSNLAAAEKCAQVAQELGLRLVSFHAGFLPHSNDDPERVVLIERLRQLADVFADRGVRVAFETGQESAQTLLEVLDEIGRDSVGINFDPANMILYGMGDPCEALRTLSGRVLQVHIKDAKAAKLPGTWGAEVPVGTGDVDWMEFFQVFDECGIDCDLMIEREAGEQRVLDMSTALTVLEDLQVAEVEV
ncbi:MAG: L-ribulose-5-phosphate 3-epimerase [Planctomycetota bacterium]|jgi:L-ribulose-5-phosphate 3-epimerase